MKIGWVLVSLLAATPITAQGLSKSKNSSANVLKKAQQQTVPDWYEPRRGTAERKALMNALRPLAEDDLGAPVEFVVHDLRVSGDRAYAAVQPQRPGGKEIALEDTPGYFRGDFSEDTMDGTNIHVLYARKGETWVVMEYSVGAMDVWFAGEPFCSSWGPVIAEFCY